MSKKTTTFVTAAFVALTSLGIAQESSLRLAGSKVLDKSGVTNLPNFIKLNVEQELKQENFLNWAVYTFNVPSSSTFKPYSVETDALGYTHVRHKQYVNNYPVEGSMVISHSREGKITMVNGDYYQNFSSNLSASLSEQDALQNALNKVSAKKYMWEDQPLVTARKTNFFPKGELVIVHKKDADYSANNMRLAYKFNIYAEVPLYRANVFVDANTGEILNEQNLICTADVVGSAVTKYSGTKTMTCDNASGPFRLRETGRGNGIETYNMATGTNYASATDFTNGSSSWTSTGNDQAATDAHWGAEMCYDYYQNIHSRNSIDGSGFALISYVHYSTNFVNAFWDGQEMTYGDGNGSSFKIMTALDVCGHEITHGLTNFTAGLGSGEAGALNESFSDIFGTCIENYARPSQWDWKMGADLTSSGQGIRNMSNPGLFGDPDTYLGTNWDTGLEPHMDAGPSNFWFYLLTQGGTGTNDLGNAYNVTGQTMAKSSKIAFRGLTVYFTPNTSYTNARTFTEQAAVDLYGSCSPELTATSSAWYAVGVGSPATSGSPLASFNTGSIASCSMPVTVAFTNTSSGAQSYAWNFGDGGTSTTASPSHTYTVAGTYTITLVATGCGGSSTNTTTQVVTIGTVGATLPLVEGFEGLTSIPTGWTLSNPDNDAAWQINSTVAKTGTKSMGFNNCDGDGATDMTGRIDKVYTKNYNFSTMSAATLSFDVAYAVLTYSGTPYYDKLALSASIDCGATWTQIYSKTGTTLASAPGYTSIATCWVPTSTQWRNDAINLAAYVGKPNVMFAFENTSAWGTWIYIDNVNINGTTGIASLNSTDGFNIYPNPASTSLTIEGTDHSGKVHYAVYNMSGQEVKLGDVNSSANGFKETISIGDLSAGMYFIRLNDEKNSWIKKVSVE